MSITVTGLSHHTSPVELRERMAFDAKDIPAALLKLRKRLPEAGAVILSTCNRVEVYLRSDAPLEKMFREVRDFLIAWHGIEESAFSEYLYERANAEAIGHLFRVASSIDSMVVGEDQILKQVHEAYLLAQAEEATDKVLGQAFQRAFKVAKEVRTKTEISTGKVSVASVAVDLAVSIFTKLSDKTVMVIGSGETGELALKALVEHGVGNVIVANRTLTRAEALAAAYNGEAIALEALRDHLHRADIVISSTGSPQPILHGADFQSALKKRDRAPIFAIDIAVPRDINKDVNELDNVYLYDIDGLEQVTEANLEARRAEVDRCMAIITRQVELFMHWRRGLHAEPTLVSMSQEMHAIRERELAKTLAALPELSDKERAEIEYLTKRIVNNILRRPMMQIKQEIVQEDPHRVLHLVKRLFGLEETTS